MRQYVSQPDLLIVQCSSTSSTCSEQQSPLCVMQAPDGQTFYSYAKAQEHWQALGETPLRQPFSDVSKSSRRVARLPSGWEVKAIHRDVGKRQGQVHH